MYSTYHVRIEDVQDLFKMDLFDSHKIKHSLGLFTTHLLKLPIPPHRKPYLSKKKKKHLGGKEQKCPHNSPNGPGITRSGVKIACFLCFLIYFPITVTVIQNTGCLSENILSEVTKQNG